MRRLRALDLYCRAGGVSEGLLRAGFDVVGVDLLDCSKAYNRGPGNPDRHERPAVFVQADALEYPLEGFDLICASPPCQAHSILRKLRPDKEYPDLIPQTRERLRASGIPYCIENVPGAPIDSSIVLCGTMFGLQTPDGRAELRRHRHFETSWPVAMRPECRHGEEAPESLSVCGTGMGPGNRGKEAQMQRRKTLLVAGNGPQVLEWSQTRKARREVEREGRRTLCVAGGKAMFGGMMTPQGELKRRAISVVGNSAEMKLEGYTGRRAISVTGNTPQTNLERNTVRETFSTADARHAMGIDWMAMKDLSQAIPPVYAHFLGLLFLGESPVHLLASGGCQVSLF